MNFLIDGYNLMHAIGLVRQGLPEGGLERARLRFLNWLSAGMGGRSETIRVVFDAQNVSRRSPESEHRGIRVLYSFHQTADDLIEELLAGQSGHEKVTVVSNDSRLRIAAQRSRASMFTCEQFVDWLITVPHQSQNPPPVPEKPEQGASADELAEFLEAFSVPKRKKR